MPELPPPRIPTLDEIRAAGRRIAGTAVRTPLVRLEGTAEPEVWLKLESLQPINAFKIRGAAAAITALPEAERARGVWTISAGNAGQGVAYAARQAGVPATVLVIETAPETKLRRMRELGARLVPAPFDACWQAMDDRAFPGIEGVFIHPFDDHEFIAGNATAGLEILEDLPDVRVVAAAVGGGGLTSGLGAAVKALTRGREPPIRVVGVEPETAAPAALSYRRGEPLAFPEWQATFVDGAGGKSLFPRMWERMRQVVDETVVVTLDEVRDAMRVLAERARIIAEGAGALPVAAALTGKLGAEGPVVAVVSGGNIDLKKFAELVGAVEQPTP
ncbi:MAG TPA: pyridoxal-phosphate dependent enzyme [Thermoanaerobaculia bacterium]|nr:pyridoxal-phosphate dependent enzyme [Thermoanaerobaculia bacterium]